MVCIESRAACVHRFFLCIKPLVEPVHCLIHPFIRERERGAFFLIIRSLFKAPGFRIYICGEGSAVPAVVGCKQIPHSLMASGKRFLFQPAEGYKSFINHEICIRPFQNYSNAQPVRRTQCQPETPCRGCFGLLFYISCIPIISLGGYGCKFCCNQIIIGSSFFQFSRAFQNILKKIKAAFFEDQVALPCILIIVAGYDCCDGLQVSFRELGLDNGGNFFR